MYQFVASTTAPYLEADEKKTREDANFFLTNTNMLVQLQHIHYI